MSKKCCGMIYSDDEKVCKVCGKPLSDETAEDIDKIENVDLDDESKDDEQTEDLNEEYDESEDAEEIEESDEDDEKEKDVNYLKKHIEREAILDQIFDDNGYKKNDYIKEDGEKVPYKGAGIFTLILAILGLAFIGALVYFIILNPYYIKDGEADEKLDYPELASTSDADELSTLLVPYGATVTDAVEEDVQ